MNRLVIVHWDVNDLTQNEIDNLDLPNEVAIPREINILDVNEWLTNKYGVCVESFEF